MTCYSINTSCLDEKRHQKSLCKFACVNQDGLKWIHSHGGAFENHNTLSDMSNYTREIAIKECYLPSLVSFSLLQSHLIEVKRFEKEGKENETERLSDLQN